MTSQSSHDLVAAHGIDLLVSSTSGNGRARKIAPEIIAILRQNGIRTRACLTTPADSVAEAARGFGDSPLLAVLGGDGYLAAAMNGIHGTGRIMLPLPGGRGNDYCRHLGIPRQPMEAVQAQLGGEVRHTDVLATTDAGGKQRLVLCAVGLGVDSVANELANSGEGQVQASTYLRGVAQALFTLPPIEYELEIDGRRLNHRGLVSSVSNTSSVGGGIKLCPPASITDGYADLVLLGAVSKPTILAALPTLALGKLHTHPQVQVIRAKKVTVASTFAGRAFADGDPLGPRPLQVSVKPGGLPTCVPATATSI